MSVRQGRHQDVDYQALRLSEELDAGLSFFPRSTSMEATNDPRFSAPTVLSNRLGAFHLVTVASVLMVNLAIGQIFVLMPGENLKSPGGIANLVGFCLMLTVFGANLIAVVIFAQQLYMTYRLETSGSTGFEMAKSFYLNPNVVAMRHLAAKCFLNYGIPVFVGSTSCMVYAHFFASHCYKLAIPVCAMIFLATFGLAFMNHVHHRIFIDLYRTGAAIEAPLHEQMQTLSSRSRGAGGERGWLGFLDA